MRRLGPPVIEAIDAGDHVRALDDSHRIAAAAYLQLTPILTIRQWAQRIAVITEYWRYGSPSEIGAAGELTATVFAELSSVGYHFASIHLRAPGELIAHAAEHAGHHAG